MRPFKLMSEILPGLTFAVGVAPTNPPPRDYYSYRETHLHRRMAPWFCGRDFANPAGRTSWSVREAGYTARVRLGDIVNLPDLRASTVSGRAIAAGWVQASCEGAYVQGRARAADF